MKLRPQNRIRSYNRNITNLRKRFLI